jgi:TonB family protein
MRSFAALVSTLTFLTACTPVLPPPPPVNPSAEERQHRCTGWYPANLRRDGVEGTTAFTLTVTVDGTVTDERIYQSSGNHELDLAALHCASHWRYFPAKQHGKPIEASIMAKVVWQLIPQVYEEAAPGK